ncbi:hypothetical protein ACQEVS_24865 [Streptomyces sp. CA-181903]|uniref:hypothetical protein n=1 Tax=Streptomyces sp. CA-181903 TaxID=3240055 RepID=UPI003D936B19
MGDRSKSVNDMSFEDIYYSFIHAKGEELSGKGLALEQAKPEIESIGDELKKHVGRTEWKGAGGDAFREWGDAFAKQIIKLAHVAGATGKEMVEAGGDIKAAVEELMKTPPGDISQCYADADKEKARLKAVADQRKALMGHDGAVKKAADKCVTAQKTIQALEIPEFRPMPSLDGGLEIGDEWDQPYGRSGGSTAAGSGGGQPYGSATGAGGGNGAGGGAGAQATRVADPGASGAQLPPPAHGDTGTGPVHVPAGGHDGTGSDQGTTGTRIDSGPAAPPAPAPTAPPSTGPQGPADHSKSLPPLPPLPTGPSTPGYPVEVAADRKGPAGLGPSALHPSTRVGLAAVLVLPAVSVFPGSERCRLRQGLTPALSAVPL